LSARRAIVKAVAAQTNVNLRLAGTAILFTITLLFSHLALHAAILVFGRGGHKRTLARVHGSWKVPLVTISDQEFLGNAMLEKRPERAEAQFFDREKLHIVPDDVSVLTDDI
jgi:hypothetical protein